MTKSWQTLGRFLRISGDTVEPRFHDTVLGWYGGNAINQSISTMSMPPEDFPTGKAKISLSVAKVRAKAGKEE